MTFKCLVLGCENRSDAGTMIGPLCAPCHDMLVTGKPNKGNDWVSNLKRERDDLHDAMGSIIRTVGGVRKLGC